MTLKILGMTLSVNMLLGMEGQISVWFGSGMIRLWHLLNVCRVIMS